MEVRLGAWQPKYFNQNGELANVKVLANWLEVAGIRADFLPILSPSEVDRVDFMLVGDAGRAAIRHFNSDLLSLADRVRKSESSATVLFLGKAFEAVSAEVFGLPLAASKRVSEYREFDSAFGKIRGYLNSRQEPVAITESHRIWGSSLHGPILASSPGFRRKILSLLGVEDVEGLVGPKEVVALENLLNWS